MTPGELAQVMVERIKLPDYGILPDHPFSANLYKTPKERSWTGQEFSGVKCTVWLSRYWMEAVYNIVLAQFAMTTIVVAVWSLNPVHKQSDRISCDFTIVL